MSNKDSNGVRFGEVLRGMQPQFMALPFSRMEHHTTTFGVLPSTKEPALSITFLFESVFI
jgi:hypothetical protein